MGDWHTPHIAVSVATSVTVAGASAGGGAGTGASSASARLSATARRASTFGASRTGRSRRWSEWGGRAGGGLNRRGGALTSGAKGITPAAPLPFLPGHGTFRLRPQ